MKNLKKLIFMMFFILGASLNSVIAQDIHFSQFWMTPLLQNPSLSGANHDLRAIVNYKDQWRSVGTPYKTFDVSFDMKLNKKRIKKGFWAAGINIFADKAGDADMGTTQANLNLAYHVLLTEQSTLGGGLMLGVGQRNINYTQLQWMSQYDGTSYNSTLPTGESAVGENFTYADIGAGVSWAYSKGESFSPDNDHISANAGLAVFHVNRPRYSFDENSTDQLNMKYVVHGNLLFGIKGSNYSIVPGLMFTSQGSSNEFMIGSLFRYTLKEASKVTGFVQGSAFSFGAHYRSMDALIATVMMEMGPYALGLSYDINTSGLTPASNGRGGIEIALRFVNPNPFLSKSRSRL